MTADSLVRYHPLCCGNHYLLSTPRIGFVGHCRALAERAAWATTDACPTQGCTNMEAPDQVYSNGGTHWEAHYQCSDDGRTWVRSWQVS
jgi:hypothetical protein